MTKTNQDTTCPQCDGPVEVTKRASHYVSGSGTPTEYRSTAAEQLAKRDKHIDELENRMTKRMLELTAAGNTLVDLEQQLADKERETSIDKEQLVAQRKVIDKTKAKLTAANAVVEDIKMRHRCMKIEGGNSGCTTCNIIKEYDKLQGRKP